MLLLAWHGCWHRCTPKILPSLPNEMQRWSSNSSSAVITSTNNRASSKSACRLIWTFESKWQWKKVYFVHEGHSNKICQIGAPAKNWLCNWHWCHFHKMVLAFWHATGLSDWPGQRILCQIKWWFVPKVGHQPLNYFTSSPPTPLVLQLSRSGK